MSDVRETVVPVEESASQPMRLSQVLAQLASSSGERVPFASILETLSDRSFAILMVLLGLPNCLPMPPPVPSVSALLLILIASQIAMRRSEPWFPRRVMQGSVAASDLKRAVRRALPVVNTLEKWSRPRLRMIDARTGAYLSALLLLAMALGMLTAAPVIGQVPFGLAVCLVGLGQVERDGLLVLSGLVAGVLGAALSASFVYAMIVALTSLFP